MTGRRGRGPAPRSRAATAALAAGGVAAGGAVVLAVVLWPGGGTGGGEAGGADNSRPVKPAEPSPTYPMSKAPQTVPAVSEHRAARGPGWRPGPDGQVVVAEDDADDLADEGRLLAGELQLTYAEGKKAGPGDVELALGSGKAGAEAYTLDVSDKRVRISATGDAGVFYGTRTLKQLTRGDGTAPEGVIRDEPAKPQRGFMLDIARKHFSAEWIEERIRELADLKYNQLGLHFSDDQAFRIESDEHPEVVSKERLSKAEVRRIVKLASDLHITVIPEIDSPGHLGAVIAAHPDLQLLDVRGVPTRGAVDISKPAAAKIVDELLKEYAELFPGAYWHLGADEYQALVKSDPQASYPQLARAAQQKYGGAATVQDLAAGWLNDRADTVRPTGKKLKAWNDGFFRGGTVKAAEDIEVEYWTGKEIGAREPVEYLDEGRKVANLNDEYLYYVLGEPNDFTYPTGKRIYEQWTPLVLRGTKPVAGKYDDQIVGGSFAVWCDLSQSQTQKQVADGIRMPLWAFSQKVWDEREPALPWGEFEQLARRLG